MLDTLSPEQCRTRNLLKSSDLDVEVKNDMLGVFFVVILFCFCFLFRKSGVCFGKTSIILFLMKSRSRDAMKKPYEEPN